MLIANTVTNNQYPARSKKGDLSTDSQKLFCSTSVSITLCVDLFCQKPVAHHHIIIGEVFFVQCNPLIWNGSEPPLYLEKPYKRDSPIPIHTQKSGPGDRTLSTDIPCIWTTLLVGCTVLAKQPVVYCSHNIALKILCLRL